MTGNLRFSTVNSIKKRATPIVKKALRLTFSLRGMAMEPPSRVPKRELIQEVFNKSSDLLHRARERLSATDEVIKESHDIIAKSRELLAKAHELLSKKDFRRRP